MKALVICFSVAFALVATVAVMPASGWVFRNQIDALKRSIDRFEAGNSPENTDVIDAFMPDWLTDPRTYTGSDPSEQLTHALLSSYPARNEALEAYARAHPNDATAWAVVARIDCTTSARTPDEPPSTDLGNAERATNTIASGRDACLKGEILEPANSYFSLMLAAFDMESNRLAEMDAALKRAAGKSKYDNHVRDEALAMEKAELLERGYRGELVKTGIGASMLLPDFAHMKALGRYLNRQGALTERRDLIQWCDTMFRHEQTAIGILIAMADVKYALRDPMPMQGRIPKLSDGDWLRLASGFDSKLRAAKLAPTVPGTLEIYRTLDRLYHATEQYVQAQQSVFEEEGSDDNSIVRVFYQTTGPFAALTALIFSMLFSAFAWGFSRIQSETFRQMLPHLILTPVWIVTLCLRSEGIDRGMPTAGLFLAIAQLNLAFLRLQKRDAAILTSFFAAAFTVVVTRTFLADSRIALATALFCIASAASPWLIEVENRSKIATGLGGALAMLALFVSDIPAAIGGIAYALAIGLLWKTRSGNSPKPCVGLAVAVFLLASAGAGIVFTYQQLNDASLGALLAGAGSLGIAAACLFTCKPTQSAKAAACISMVLFGLVYVGAVGNDVRANQREMLAKSNLLNEANNIRRQIGLKSDP